MAYTTAQYRADAVQVGRNLQREGRKWLRGLWKIRTNPQQLFGPTLRFGTALFLDLVRLFFYSLRRLTNI